VAFKSTKEVTATAGKDVLSTSAGPYGKAHPDVAVRYCSMGGLYRTAGDTPTAFEYFAKALEVEFSSGTSHER
jgi:hypothetical protein